jgi:hypothetical protein
MIFRGDSMALQWRKRPLVRKSVLCPLDRVDANRAPTFCAPPATGGGLRSHKIFTCTQLKRLFEFQPIV